MYVAKYPDKVRAIAPISCFVTGELYRQTLSQQELQDWQAKGYMEEVSISKPGLIKRISWRFLEDSLSHDMRDLAPKVKCPALFVVGSEDVGTPEIHQRQLIGRMAGRTELHVIAGMQHNPRSKEHNAELKKILLSWIKRQINDNR